MTDPIMRIERILSNLPVLAGRRGTIRKEAEFLLLHAGLTAVNDLPRVTQTGNGQASKELLRLSKLLQPLVQHIDNMHATALDALTASASFPHPIILVRNLKLMETAAADAAERMKGERNVIKTGRLPKRHAAAVRERSAQVFERLTGRKPAPSNRLVPINDHTHGWQTYGAFVDFLNDIFAACGIDAKGESQAKALGKKGT